MRFSLPGLAIALLGTAANGQPAWADADAPPAHRYVIVQQALSYLVTDPSSSSTAQALMKADDELSASDQSGVNTAEVTKARAALQCGDTSSGRTLLQDSIAVAVSSLQPAVGEETGTTVVIAPYVPAAASLPRAGYSSCCHFSSRGWCGVARSSATPPGIAGPQPRHPRPRRLSAPPARTPHERMGISAPAYPAPEHANRLRWTLGGVTAVNFLGWAE